MRICEIFTSCDGEVNGFHQGHISTFIRCSGCNFFEHPCLYCDTRRAADPDSGSEMSVDEIVGKVLELGCKKITITGGEPLFQKEEVTELTNKLWRNNCFISVETNGSIGVGGYGVGSWVVDFKLPSSGNYDKMEHSIFRGLCAADFVKFVISDRNDFDTAVREKNYLQSIGCTAKFAFSPVFGPCGTIVDKTPIVDWLVKGRVFDAIVNVQIHKILQTL